MLNQGFSSQSDDDLVENYTVEQPCHRLSGSRSIVTETIGSDDNVFVEETGKYFFKGLSDIFFSCCFFSSPFFTTRKT